MTRQIMNRAALKSACLQMLDHAALEHPAGHQGKLAARYVLRSSSGERIALMFEKGEKSKPHLWVSRVHAGDLMQADIEFREYPGSSLYPVAEDGGQRPYGRHAALKAMRDLANADLVRFAVDRVGQMEAILERLAAI